MKVPKQPADIQTKKEKPEPKAAKKKKSTDTPKKRMLSDEHLKKLQEGRQKYLEAKKKVKENSE